MPRKLSAAQAKSKAVAALVAVDHLALPRRRDTRASAGLAGLAGGWKGSEDLVKALRKIRRTRPQLRS